MLESLSNKVAGLRPVTLSKRDSSKSLTIYTQKLHHRYFTGLSIQLSFNKHHKLLIFLVLGENLI